jgi:hypothetical protein
MDADHMRDQARRWRALAERCDARGAHALGKAADTLDREADAIEGAPERFGPTADRSRSEG